MMARRNQFLLMVAMLIEWRNHGDVSLPGPPRITRIIAVLLQEIRFLNVFQENQRTKDVFKL